MRRERPRYALLYAALCYMGGSCAGRFVAFHAAYLAVAAALAVAGAFAFLGWMFGPVSIPPLTVSVPTLSVPHIDADSLKPWLPLFPVFILLFAFDWWLSRRRRSH